MVEVVEATLPSELDEVRALFRAFVAWHRQRHVEDLGLVDGYFDTAAFDAELGGLPGAYAPPRGRLLLARQAGEPAGCVALRPINDASCEMKRMFVDPHRHGQGVGRALADAIVGHARDAGYSQMWLDTSTRQTEAQNLYRSMGFETVDAYYDLPPELVHWLVFMRLKL